MTEKNLRITKNQKEKLVEYMSTHLEFARGQFGGMNSNVQNKGDWVLLTTTLNSLGGSMKTTDQWKKCWIDLKSGVKKKANSRRSFFNKTGGGSLKDAPPDLNDFEEQILAVMGTHAVHGDSTAVEGGVPPLAEPFFSIEVLEDEDMDESSKFPIIDTQQTNKSLEQKKRPPFDIKDGIDEARGMHAAVIESIEKLESKIEKLDSKIENVHSKLDNVEKQNNNLLVKFECLIDLLNKDSLIFQLCCLHFFCLVLPYKVIF